MSSPLSSLHFIVTTSLPVLSNYPHFWRIVLAVLKINLFLFIINSEELGSDEDDIDEDGQEYLEILAKQAGEDGDDEDWEEDDAEETALEGYSTIIDDEDNPIDEYQIFKTIFQSK